MSAQDTEIARLKDIILRLTIIFGSSVSGAYKDELAEIRKELSGTES